MGTLKGALGLALAFSLSVGALHGCLYADDAKGKKGINRTPKFKEVYDPELETAAAIARDGTAEQFDSLKTVFTKRHPGAEIVDDWMYDGGGWTDRVQIKTPEGNTERKVYAAHPI